LNTVIHQYHGQHKDPHVVMSIEVDPNNVL
jgi:hypothetical protein